jgi:hypothetical protein
MSATIQTQFFQNIFDVWSVTHRYGRLTVDCASLSEPTFCGSIAQISTLKR